LAVGNVYRKTKNLEPEPVTIEGQFDPRTPGSNLRP
jgi:hypothetical protein